MDDAYGAVGNGTTNDAWSPTPVLWPLVPAAPVTLTGVTTSSDGSFQFSFTNNPGARFTVRMTKRAIDGALGSRGAWMLEPYADLATTTGMLTDSLDDMRMIAELAIANDYQMAVHAIGDRGNRETLNIYEAAFMRHPDKNSKALRWRIEHAQHISAADIPRFGRLGVIASTQLANEELFLPPGELTTRAFWYTLDDELLAAAGVDDPQIA
jgi:predicted amidohydrolase YtcJ